jgi:signal transduction histidine kinase
MVERVEQTGGTMKFGFNNQGFLIDILLPEPV